MQSEEADQDVMSMEAGGMDDDETDNIMEAADDGKYPPQSFVFSLGGLKTPNVAELVTGMRRLMEPNTATRLRVSRFSCSALLNIFIYVCVTLYICCCMHVCLLVDDDGLPCY